MTFGMQAVVYLDAGSTLGVTLEIIWGARVRVCRCVLIFGRSFRLAAPRLLRVTLAVESCGLLYFISQVLVAAADVGPVPPAVAVQIRLVLDHHALHCKPELASRLRRICGVRSAWLICFAAVVAGVERHSSHVRLQRWLLPLRTVSARTTRLARGRALTMLVGALCGCRSTTGILSIIAPYFVYGTLLQDSQYWQVRDERDFQPSSFVGG
jgi:hypothetical protein